MDRLADLQTFVGVVESGSFSAAAERLNVAKSAVSRRVAALESRLGVQLFARTTRRLNLTDSGKSFYEHCVRILADLEEAESAVMQAHGELRGRLRVALPVSFGLRHMRGPILEFAGLHPLVEFDLDFNDRRVDLLEEGIDVAIRIGRLSDSSLIARALFQATTVLCASPHYLEQHGVPRTRSDWHHRLGFRLTRPASVGFGVPGVPTGAADASRESGRPRHDARSGTPDAAAA